MERLYWKFVSTWGSNISHPFVVYPFISPSILSLPLHHLSTLVITERPSIIARITLAGATLPPSP
jgi:hypothetical protein